MSYTVAIVGRPNVGKSTLFNRLVGRRTALVDDRPGVTRDRREGHATLADLHFTIIDTAGLENAGPETLPGRMQRQTETAIASADAILFVVDARSGITPIDETFAQLIRRAAKPTVLVANKSEGRAAQTGALEAFRLGLGEPILFSAEHGEGTSDLYAALRATFAALDAANADAGDATRTTDETHPVIKVAVVGRPNAGKSTLINRLLGQDRLLTGPEPGITRDAIAVDIAWGNRQFRVHDTAGMRRRAKVVEKLEKLSVGDALNAIRFAEVVVLLLDAERPFEDQDLKIADLVVREGRALVVAVNKSDLVDRKSGAPAKLREEVDHWLPQVKGVPIVSLSGLHGHGLDRLMAAVVAAFDVWNRRIATAALNRWLGEATANHPPPAVSGRRIKINYMTQPKARPPTFVLFCSRSDAVPEAYRRYLINGLREAFDLPGTPVRLNLREKDNPYAERA
jgi:GTP-binding protein